MGRTFQPVKVERDETEVEVIEVEQHIVEVDDMRLECDIKTEGNERIASVRVISPRIGKPCLKKLCNAMCKAFWISSADIHGKTLVCKLQPSAESLSIKTILRPIVDEIQSSGNKSRRFSPDPSSKQHRNATASVGSSRSGKKQERNWPMPKSTPPIAIPRGIGLIY